MKMLRIVLHCLFFTSLCFFSIVASATSTLNSVYSRDTTSLNGEWQYIVDPYKTGFYDYRFKEMSEDNPAAYWNINTSTDKSKLIEHGYSDSNTLQVPGDWNSQEEKFLYYEGTVWYKKSFDYEKKHQDNLLFVYFAAVNYEADVYLNGEKLGNHVGGFTPFQFAIPSSLLRSKDNHLVVKVDNERAKDAVPTVNTDWWNYGGITRDVMLVETPSTYIQSYELKLEPTDETGAQRRNATISGQVSLGNAKKQEQVTIRIPELNLTKKVNYQGENTAFEFSVPHLTLWSDTNPKRYEVAIETQYETIKDKIGFRTIEVVGNKILLNGEPIFLRGICLHEEIAPEIRRANSPEDAEFLLGAAEELNVNFVRLAHYPHNEHIVRKADEMGLLVWSEIPVYWTIDFSSEAVLNNAKNQLREMISRDQNRASVIVWSVGNETPVSDTRTTFMKALIDEARALDDSRLISAALEVHYNEGMNTINDPLGEFTDVVSVNEYLGWYVGLPEDTRTAKWESVYDKPLLISETGAGAKQGFHADKQTRWSEEFQAAYYRGQIAMMEEMPEGFSGITPWVLFDFRSPKRNHPGIQEGWNRKGLISNEGEKKQAFQILKNYYDRIEKASE
ncbi:glycoside hydrolase family 2 protein [Salinimonas chungwhensis]|uniref:glycoside hydrolase family 2 protein n=1 Tax=Salinimonas chungwhensis TaxID=265425 RepID=UPI0004780EC7|nr:glycoside hydrolase family 2 TIM barrel-domain containing protein [Salinimonas chungwhensis]